MAFLMNPFAAAFGLDIGDRTFKIVQVKKRRGAARQCRITAWGSVDVPEGVMAQGEIKNMDVAVERIGALIRGAERTVRGRGVVACLPEARTFIKVIDIPEGTADVEDAIFKEIERNIPLSRDALYIDWQPLAGGRALVGAAPKTIVDSYAALLERAGLVPIALEIEAAAISRAIVPANEPADEAIGILDIGATRSSLVICDDDALRMSISVPISGIAITKLVSEQLNVGLDEAENLKRECGLDADRCEDRLWKILLPLIDDMTQKIHGALQFYGAGSPAGKKIDRIFLCGGGAQFREIDSVLSRKLAMKVRRGDALANIDPKLPKKFPSADALAYSTAIGLAIRAADENQQYESSLY